MARVVSTILLLLVTKISAQKLTQKTIELKARQIDKILEKALSKANKRMMPKVGNDILLKRTSLDIVGRIATVQEARDFILLQEPGNMAVLLKING